MKKRIKRVRRKGQLTETESSRLDRVREKVTKEFPPAANRSKPTTTGIGAKIRKAREAQGLTWYALAKQAGISNPATIRDIEYGRDTRLSSIEAIAKVLGLKLDLVEA